MCLAKFIGVSGTVGVSFAMVRVDTAGTELPGTGDPPPRAHRDDVARRNVHDCAEEAVEMQPGHLSTPTATRGGWAT
jgi:hypothetical protein